MKKSIFLFFAAILCSVSAWSYNYGGTNVYYYFANTGSWSNVYLYIWNNDNTWNTNFALNKIANTNVYYHKWSSAYNNNGGILFRASTANWDNKTNDIKADYTSHTSWVHNSTTGKTDLSNINRSAQVAVKLSTGGNYTQTANANCVAQVSGYTVEKGKSSATAKNASTSGSSATASISAAYGSTITYTATAGTGYTFEGFSTSNSTTLPATKYASGKTATASGYGSTNNSTYYAYFKANQYTVKFDANGGTGSMSDQSHTYSVSQALTPNAFTRAGYTFEGWNTNADGTGTSYTDKQSVSNLSSTDGATITLYAQWAEIPANNHNITYTAQATGWTYGATPASAEEGTTVTFVVNPTTGYTVSVTSDDVTLNKNENEYTFTMPTKDVAINVSAVENTHNVIVSYKCGGETIKPDATVEAVGEVTTISVTAPEIDGYAFDSWTLGSGIQSANTTANPISITTKASGYYTLTANYTKMVTVYLINNSNWARVYAYGWKNGEAQGTPAWPGAEITENKLAEKYEGYDVYSYKVKEGSYDNVIFNNNSGKQTETFAWTDGKYYYAVDPLGSNVYLAGEMTNWGTDKVEFKKTTAEATTASVTVNLTAKSYTFKLVRGEDWFGNYGTMQRGGDGVHEGGWSFDETAYEANCTIVADIVGDYTFTWDLTTKKLTVTYPALPKHQVTATVNPAETGEVTGTGEYEQGSKATLVATPAAGYTFKNWTVAGIEKSVEATYTFTVTEAVELVANFVPEVTHEVTVSYLCNSNPIPGHDATTLAVGVTTPSTFTAPAITNYKFDSWTVGTGVQAVDANANPIQITTKAEGEYTLTANYTKIELTYTVTVPEGTEKCYIAGDMNSWSFQEMTPTANANEFTITIDGATTAHKYKYTCGESWDYVEKKADGYDLADNRSYKANDVVAKWGDPLSTNVYLAGSMTAWNDHKIEFKKETKESKTASIVLVLTEKAYEIKIVDNGEWLGNNGIITESVDGWTFEKETNNCNLQTLVAGKYTFTWNFENKKLSVTYPVETVVPAEAKQGIFSVGQYEVAQFAPGNLQYNLGESKWTFATNQYDYIGGDNINLGDPTFTGTIDMFGWSTDETYYGVNPNNVNDLYDGTFQDWGTKMGGGWSTLSADQWKYLLNTRTNAENLKQIARVGEVVGIMLFPDNWNEAPVVEAKNDSYFEVKIYNYDLAQWANLEAAGAIFLPAAGRRAGGYGNMINKDQVVETNPANLNGGHYKHQDNTNIYCYYWTRTINESTKDVSYLHNIQALGGDKYTIGTGAVWGEKGRYGQSVRLAKVTSTLIEIGDGDNSAALAISGTVNVEVTRQFETGKLYTISLPFTLENVSSVFGNQAYEYTSLGKDGENVVLYFSKTNTMESGKPYLIEPAHDVLGFIVDDVTLSNTTNNISFDAGTNTVSMEAVLSAGDDAETDGKYWLASDRYLYDNDTKLKSLRAVFTISSASSIKPRARVAFSENAATGLDNITNGENTTIKLIENGQLIIIRNGEKFNAQGVRF